MTGIDEDKADDEDGGHNYLSNSHAFTPYPARDVIVELTSYGLALRPHS